jgi:hypothetical protein
MHIPIWRTLMSFWDKRFGPIVEFSVHGYYCTQKAVLKYQAEKISEAAW